MAQAERSVYGLAGRGSGAGLIKYDRDISMPDSRRMGVTLQQPIDWSAWLRRWDEQQTRYLPEREQRFQIMLDVLGEFLPDEFIALDLACGPGAISQRLLTRFPKARIIAIDLNPILLKLGREAVGTLDRRLRWVQGNLMESGWTAQIVEALNLWGRTHVDAVLSTTALHWLPANDLISVYQQIGTLLRPGGVFLNGDHMAFEPALPSFRQLARQSQEKRRREAFEMEGGEDYQTWWSAIEQEITTPDPALQHLVDEHRQNEAARRHDFSEPIFAVHEAALKESGFTEVGTIWQMMDNRILLAIRGNEVEPIRV